MQWYWQLTLGKERDGFKVDNLLKLPLLGLLYLLVVVEDNMVDVVISVVSKAAHCFNT